MGWDEAQVVRGSSRGRDEAYSTLDTGTGDVNKSGDSEYGPHRSHSGTRSAITCQGSSRVVSASPHNGSNRRKMDVLEGGQLGQQYLLLLPCVFVTNRLRTSVL